jgi:hypothetical protein
MDSLRDWNPDMKIEFMSATPLGVSLETSLVPLVRRIAREEWDHRTHPRYKESAAYFYDNLLSRFNKQYRPQQENNMDRGDTDVVDDIREFLSGPTIRRSITDDLFGRRDCILPPCTVTRITCETRASGKSVTSALSRGRKSCGLSFSAQGAKRWPEQAVSAAGVKK